MTGSSDIAEAFNSHFTRIGEELATEIPKSDVDPLTYVKPTNSSFGFRESPTNDVLPLLRNINTKKGYWA